MGYVGRDCTHLIPEVCNWLVLRILAIAVCRIGDVCCLPAPAHSLDLSAPEEAYSRHVRASDNLKFWYESVFKILLISSLHLAVSIYVYTI